MITSSFQYVSVGGPESKDMPLYSLREMPLTIDQGGAQLMAAPSAVDFFGEDFNRPIEPFVERSASQRQYYSELEALARKALGVDQVVHAWCTSHIVRRSSDAPTAVGTTAGPIKFVHNDFTEEYGDITRRRYTTHPSQNAKALRYSLKVSHGLEFTDEEIGQYRIVVLNTWRPINPGPLRREPLAVCDNRSIRKSDLFSFRTNIGKNDDDPDDDFALEVYVSRYNADHRWHYVPDFTCDELLLFKTFDSDMNPFVPTMHSAFNLPCQGQEPPRRSLEARVICLMKRSDAYSASERSKL